MYIIAVCVGRRAEKKNIVRVRHNIVEKLTHSIIIIVLFSKDRDRYRETTLLLLSLSVFALFVLVIMSRIRPALNIEEILYMYVQYAHAKTRRASSAVL